jgi:hypothetical protein
MLGNKVLNYSIKVLNNSNKRSILFPYLKEPKGSEFSTNKRLEPARSGQVAKKKLWDFSYPDLTTHFLVEVRDISSSPWSKMG